MMGKYVKIFHADQHDEMWSELKGFRSLDAGDVHLTWTISYSEKNNGYIVIVNTWRDINGFSDVVGWYELKGV